MTRKVLLAGFLAACGLLLSGVTYGNIPSPANSDFPAFIDVVGRSGDLSADGRGSFSVTVRDIGGMPISDTQVTVDLCDCYDMEIDEVQEKTYPPPGNVDCANRRIWTTTDVQGRAVFCIVGAAENRGLSPGPGRDCGRIIADGIVLGLTTAVETDENGHAPIGANPGVEITDLSCWLADWGGGMYFGRSDFNHSGELESLDIPAWLKVYGPGTSYFGPKTFCTSECP